MLGGPRGYPLLAGLFGWAAMVLFLACAFGARYLAGTLGDPDISSMVEATLVPVPVMTLPLGAVAFGIYVPCFMGIRKVIGRRISTPVWLAIGTLFAVPAFVFLAVAGDVLSPQSFVTVVTRMLSHPSALSLVATLVAGGLVTGVTYMRLSAARSQRESP